MTSHEHKYRSITIEKANGELTTFFMNDEESEPVFFLRAQDQYAPEAVSFYAESLKRDGHEELAIHASEHAAEMEAWPIKKIPD